jgi:hypothetical protein
VGFALILGGVLLLSPPAVSGGVLWDLGIACGYVGAVLCICLYVFPVRGDGLPHARLLGMSQHRLIGWCVLAAVVIHVLVLVLAQPQVGRYLLPSAPLYMWCGVAALILAGVLVQTGLSARSAMRHSGSMGRASAHTLLAALMILVLCAHLIGSGQLISGQAKAVAVLLLFALPLGWFALRVRSSRLAHSQLRRTGHLATMVAVALLPSPLAKHVLLEPARRPAPMPVNFPHERHISVSCIECHHNFVDHTGTLPCIECHRSGRPDLGRSIESTFHTFCRDCHAQLAAERVSHGPTRGCLECHHGTRSSSL